MIESIVVAVVIAIIVGALLVYLLGPIIKTVPAPVAAIAGDFFIKWGWAVGILVGLLWYFGGGSIFGFGGKR